MDTELLKKAKRLDAIRVQERKLAIEKDKLVAEIREAVPVGTSITAGSWGIKVHSAIGWQSFNGERVSGAYPIEDFPEIYAPSYKLTKEFLTKLKNGDSVTNYCGETIRVDIIKPKGRKRATPTRDLMEL